MRVYSYKSFLVACYSSITPFAEEFQVLAGFVRIACRQVFEIGIQFWIKINPNRVRKNLV